MKKSREVICDAPLNRKQKEQRVLEHFQMMLPAYTKYCTGKLRDYEAAEDVVATVFGKVWQYVEKIDMTEDLDVFVFSCLKNGCIDYQRVRRVQTISLEESNETMVLIQRELESKLIGEIELFRQLSKLPEQKKRMIIQFLAGVKAVDASLQAGIACNAYQKQLKRAIRSILPPR